MSDEKKFEPGNVVRLKSGGLKMTVERAGAREIYCCWFDLKGKLCKASIPQEALEKAEDDDDA